MRQIFQTILVCFISFCFYSASTTTGMEVPETSHDFGVIAPDQKVERLFKIINNGKEERIIEKTKTSCACAAAIVSEEKIKPGKEGIVKVAYDAAKGPLGKFTKSVEVFLKGDKAPITFTIRGLVKKKFDPETAPAISITPEAIDLGEMLLGEGKRFSIRIENKGKGDLLIKNIKAVNENTGTPLNKKSILPGQKIEATISYFAKDAGKIDTSFSIISNDPFSPVISINITGMVNVPGP